MTALESTVATVEPGISGDDAAPTVIERFLTDEQIQHFMDQGVLVVPNVLTPEEVAEARRGLHGELAKYKVVRCCLSWCGLMLQWVSGIDANAFCCGLTFRTTRTWQIRVTTSRNCRVLVVLVVSWTCSIRRGD